MAESLWPPFDVYETMHDEPRQEQTVAQAQSLGVPPAYSLPKEICRRDARGDSCMSRRRKNNGIYISGSFPQTQGSKKGVADALPAEALVGVGSNHGQGRPLTMAACKSRKRGNS